MKERDTIYHTGGRRGDDIHLTPDVSFIRNPDVAHEVSDVSVGPIAKFVVGLFIFGVVVCVLMLLLFKFFEARAKSNELPPSPVARQGKERLPPEPRLQGAPGFGIEERSDVLTAESERKLELREPQAEMKSVRKIWDHDLGSYGLVEGAPGQPGRVRIPIEEAKKLMARREAEKTQGQPTSEEEQNKIEGETIPSSSSSGRQPERRNQ
ncbi:MAG: hypothetical protein ACR2LZ_09150 [Pyrinomonadaceae bacterium]